MGDVAADAEEEEDEEDEAEEVVAVVSVGSVPAAVAVAAQAEGALDGKEGGGRDREGKTKMAGSRGSFGEIGPVTGEAATATGETTGGAESAARARTTISEHSSITVAIPGFGHEHVGHFLLEALQPGSSFTQRHFRANTRA